MIQRTALLAASLVASLMLAVGLVLVGFAPRADPVDAGQTAPTAQAQPAPTVQVDTVYVAPQAQPQEVTVHKVVRTSGHGDDEQEGGGDD